MRVAVVVAVLLVVSLMSIVVVAGPRRHFLHSQASLRSDETKLRPSRESGEEFDDVDVVNDVDLNPDPMPLPRLNKKDKWALIRASGQDPTTRRRGQQFLIRHEKLSVRKRKRDLAQKPWRIVHAQATKKPIVEPLKPAVALPIDVCPKSFDAVTKGYNGRTYVFSRERVFQVWYDDGLPQKSSFLVREMFPGGPRTVSAALTNTRSGVTTLFEGRTAYRFRWNRKYKRFQLAKNTPQQLPRNITLTPQGAFEWVDGNQVVVAGEHFIIYDAYWNLATFTSHTRRYFPNLPRDLLGIVYNSGDSTLLLYTKTNKLKVYNAKKFKVVQEYPLKLSEFVGCIGS